MFDIQVYRLFLYFHAFSCHVVGMSRLVAFIVWEIPVNSCRWQHVHYDCCQCCI